MAEAPGWDVARYQNLHSFVWHYGESLVDLLSPQPGERILDLGCGTGQLTQKLAEYGALVEGLDADPAMVTQAQQNYPHLSFRMAKAQGFTVDVPYDAVFSNAVLHWVLDPAAVLTCVWQALRPGGRFVAEFGGKGNVQTIMNALQDVLGQSAGPPVWYFPSLAEYAALLEAQGFEVTDAHLFDRPTPLADGEKGLAHWLRMFGTRCFQGMSEAEVNQVVLQIEIQLKASLYQAQENLWIADYRRLRVRAVKQSMTE
jgi:trans-aconitate methyltransferase